MQTIHYYIIDMYNFVVVVVVVVFYQKNLGNFYLRTLERKIFLFVEF